MATDAYDHARISVTRAIDSGAGHAEVTERATELRRELPTPRSPEDHANKAIAHARMIADMKGSR
jgi:hypothetical protein